MESFEVSNKTETTSPTLSGLTCPKCQGTMRSYERSSVALEQCTECRGVFLDRGELERLMQAEDAYTDSRDGSNGDHREDDDHESRGFGRLGEHRGRRRRGFLGAL